MKMQISKNIEMIIGNTSNDKFFKLIESLDGWTKEMSFFELSKFKKDRILKQVKKFTTWNLELTSDKELVKIYFK